MAIIEEVIAYGHPNIRATHKSTFEITKESTLTKRGDCIVGVKSNKACKDISELFKKSLRSNVAVKVIIECNGIKDEVIGYGDPNLILSDPTSIVIRKSSYICPRTLLIRANKAACDLDRRLVSFMKLINSIIKVKFLILL
jgi:hypothetical protein